MLAVTLSGHGAGLKFIQQTIGLLPTEEEES